MGRRRGHLSPNAGPGNVIIGGAQGLHAVPQGPLDKAPSLKIWGCLDGPWVCGVEEASALDPGLGGGGLFPGDREGPGQEREWPRW